MVVVMIIIVVVVMIIIVVVVMIVVVVVVMIIIVIITMAMVTMAAFWKPVLIFLAIDRDTEETSVKVKRRAQSSCRCLRVGIR